MKLTALIPALIIMGFVWAIDLPAILGAHPWWSGKAVLIGAPIGFGLAYLATFLLSARLRIGLFFIATAVALWAAYSGKMTFVASFGDDAFAGRIWFFGWIATMVGLAGFVLTASAIAMARGQ